MNIFIDFDNTIVKTAKAFCKIVNKNFDKDIYWRNISTYNLEEFELSDKIVGNIFESKEFFNELEEFDNAVKSVEQLSKKNNVYIVSKGTNKHLALKRMWFKYNLPEIPLIGLDMNTSKRVIDMSDGILIDDLVENLNVSNARHKLKFGTYKWDDYHNYSTAKNWDRMMKLINLIIKTEEGIEIRRIMKNG